MTDKGLKQLETETVVMIKDNIRKMCEAENLLEVYARTEVVKQHIIGLRKYIISRKFKHAGKTGECFIDEIFSEEGEE